MPPEDRGSNPNADQSHNPSEEKDLGVVLENEVKDIVVLAGILRPDGDGVNLVGDTEKEEWLIQNGYFGSKVGNDYIIDGVETLLLQERKRLCVFSAEERETIQDLAGEDLLARPSIDFSNLIAAFARYDPDIWVKYVVYRDLRSRGYIVRGGYGQGVDYRVYSRGAKSGKSEAKYLVSVIVEGKPIQLATLDTMTRLAISSRKKLILAVVDRLGEPTFYQVEQYNL